MLTKGDLNSSWYSIIQSFNYFHCDSSFCVLSLILVIYFVQMGD